MPALNFKAWLAPKVVEGLQFAYADFRALFSQSAFQVVKRNTIRARRKKPIKPGDLLLFYTGMRRPDARYLGKAVCKAVLPIRITNTDITINYPLFDPARGGTYDGNKLKAWRLTRYEQRVLAELDGFDTLEQFREFFWTEHKTRDFTGDLILW